ncbi:MAG: hypothetical protein ACI9CU_000984 [Polaribacter sp.]|jgi:hypothetical protein
MKAMKNTFTAALVLISSLSFAQNFEGVITMNTSNAEIKEEASLTWYLKANSSRIDIKSRADGYDSRYAIIIDEKGTHMVAEGHVTEIPQRSIKTESSSQTRLSQEDGVMANGFNCSKEVFFDGKNQTIYWLTKDLGIGFDDIPMVLRRSMPSIKTTGFPVKMEKRSADGKVLVSQDVLSVKSTSVSDSNFDRK